MKTEIVVTAKTLEALSPYNNDKSMPEIGETLFVIGDKIPKVRVNGYFVQVTNWKPSKNSLHIINRKNEPVADKYGWVLSSQITERAISEKKEISYFQRWAIDYEIVK
jgi:hypothetical protein